MTQRRSATGALLTAEQTAALGLLQGHMVYTKARELAEQGYDPQYCARRAQSWSNYKIAYWLYVGAWAWFCGVFMWASPLLILWKIPLVLMALVLHKRLKDYGEAPPNVRVRYGIPTGWVVSAWTLWNVIFVLGVIINLALTKPVGVQ